MPQIKQMSRVAHKIKDTKTINWYPGHMFSGMQAMMGKLNTVDCIIEIHDARIPFVGRNTEFRQHLGRIKPHVLVLNKSDLADLSRWDAVKRRLHDQGDKNVFLTDLTGSDFSFATRGYTTLMTDVIRIINESDRYNRQLATSFKVMFVGIPNVGKSTLINRLRQYHLGFKGEPAKVGPQAGVTKHVNNDIRICWRPPVYSLDTPGVLPPGNLRNKDQAMRLALCSTIRDLALKPQEVAGYLLNYLNETENQMYFERFGLDRPALCLEDLAKGAGSDKYIDEICWDFIKEFRRGGYGKIMFY